MPVLDGRGRLERAMRGEAGKSARRFLAASSVPVIRADQITTGNNSASHRSPKRIPTRRVSERSESMSRADFPDRGSRTRTASAGAAREGSGKPFEYLKGVEGEST